MKEALVFDVNETLLDMQALDPFFEEEFRGNLTRQDWFSELQTTWLVCNSIGNYKDFGVLVKAALDVVASRAETVASPSQQKSLIEQLVNLPCHTEVPHALEQLKSTGHTLTALTNGTLDAVNQQLKHAEIDHFFDHILSCDDVGMFKPAAQPYVYTTRILEKPPTHVRMIAAHAWDVAGARQVGLRTAFVEREGKQLNPAWPEPDISAVDLLEVAEILRNLDLDTE